MVIKTLLYVNNLQQETGKELYLVIRMARFEIRVILQYAGYIEDITCPRVDMDFIFEWSTRYLTSERSERVRYRVEHSFPVL